MADATPDVVAIENYIAGVINQDASTVSEVAPIAAQAAVEASGLTFSPAHSADEFVTRLSDYTDAISKRYLVRVLTMSLPNYENTDLTPTEVLQEIISQNPY